MESLFFAGAALLLSIALFGAWHGIQALQLAAKIQGGSRRLLQLAGWNLLEPFISTLVAVPFAMWGLAWTFNCGEPWQSGKSRIVQLGLIRFVLIILTCVGFFFAYVNYVIVTAGFVFLIYSLLEIIKIVQSNVTQLLTLK
jgi:hypothetical protein